MSWLLPDGSVAIKCESQISSQQQPPQPEVVVVEEVIEQDEGQVQDIEQTQPVSFFPFHKFQDYTRSGL